jgi:hypothetical protein
MDPGEAVEFLRHANDAESQNRQDGLTALKFRYGEQWPQYATASRGLDRPQLTINETNTYIKKICNAQRQQRPRGKPSRSMLTLTRRSPRSSPVLAGTWRSIPTRTTPTTRLSTSPRRSAGDTGGSGRTYILEDSFNQDIYIDVIDNPFTVYRDPIPAFLMGRTLKRA